MPHKRNPVARWPGRLHGPGARLVATVWAPAHEHAVRRHWDAEWEPQRDLLRL